MNEEEILKEHWGKVPSDIRQAVLSPDLEKNIRDILTSNNLSLEKMKDFENETILLMIGMSGTDDYIEEIGKIFSPPEDKLEKVLVDVDRIILAPIKDSLIEFIDRENSAEDIEKDQNQNDNKGKEIILENQNPFLPILSKQSATNDRQSTTTIKEELKIPNVTSAMAAEIGNLIGGIDNKQQTLDNKEQKRGDREQVASKSTPQIGMRPMDKMDNMIQQPKVEVEMVKHEAPKENRTDPYREPFV